MPQSRILAPVQAADQGVRIFFRHILADIPEQEYRILRAHGPVIVFDQTRIHLCDGGEGTMPLLKHTLISEMQIRGKI